MAFLFMNPSGLIPVLLIVLILIVLVAIIGVTIRNINERRRRMSANLKKMKRLEAAVSNLNLREQEKQVLYNKNLLNYTPEKAEKQKEEAKVKPAKKQTKASGDKTIYDDRKNLTAWQVHLSKTYRDMKKKNPNAKFSAAMKAAKKTYKKAKK